MEIDNFTPLVTITPANGGEIIVAPNSEAQPNNKRRRKKSIVWDYFSIETVGPGCTRAICNQCNKSFAYITGSKLAGTSHLKRHISLGICPASRDKNQITPYTLGSITGNSTEPPPKRRYRASPRITNTPFDQERCTQEIAKMIIQQEYPLHIVEHSGFIDFVRTLQPHFNPVTFNTIQGECLSIYLREKESLLNLISSASGRVSLTLDMWTSNQSVAYIFVTGYFIDGDWKLHCRLLNVVMVPSPDSEYVFSQAVVACLSDWHLESKLFTLTLGPSFSKDSVIENLRGLLCVRNPLLINGQLIIGDCYARVLSRLALDALEATVETVKRIRNCVKYVKTSDVHEETFDGIKKQFQVPSSKQLFVDDYTRWDTTYYMLAAACELKEVFGCLETSDHHFKMAPSMDDWKQAEILCTFLKLFIDAAELLTAASYPAASVFYPEVSKIQLELTQASMSPDPFTSNLTRPLKEKFDKYWSTCCLVLAVAVVMDPRYKMKLVEFSFPKIFGEDAGTWVRTIDDSIHELYLEYTMQMLPPLPEPFTEPSSHSHEVVPPHETYAEAGNESMIVTQQEAATYETSAIEMVHPSEIYAELGNESLPKNETQDEAAAYETPAGESMRKTETREEASSHEIIVHPPDIYTEAEDDGTPKTENQEPPSHDVIVHPPETYTETEDYSVPKSETHEAPSHKAIVPSTEDDSTAKTETQEAPAHEAVVPPTENHIEAGDDITFETETQEVTAHEAVVPPTENHVEAGDDITLEIENQEVTAQEEPSQEMLPAPESHIDAADDSTPEMETQEVTAQEEPSQEMLPPPEPFTEGSSPLPKTYDEARNDEIMHETATLEVSHYEEAGNDETMHETATLEVSHYEETGDGETMHETVTLEVSHYEEAENDEIVHETQEVTVQEEAGNDGIVHETATQEVSHYEEAGNGGIVHETVTQEVSHYEEAVNHEIVLETQEVTAQEEPSQEMLPLPEPFAEASSHELVPSPKTYDEAGNDEIMHETATHNEIHVPETYAEAGNESTSNTETRESLSHEVGPPPETYSEPGNHNTPKIEIQEPTVQEAPPHEILSEAFDGPPLEDVHFITVGDGLSDFEVYISEIASQQTKTELDQYLEESVLPRVQDFDVLGWWNMNKQKYPTLSKMASDILSVPISTIPPDSVFKTEVRNMDSYRSSLRPVTVEALICAKDWLQGGSSSLDFSNALPKMKF